MILVGLVLLAIGSIMAAIAIWNLILSEMEWYSVGYRVSAVPSAVFGNSADPSGPRTGGCCWVFVDSSGYLEKNHKGFSDRMNALVDLQVRNSVVEENCLRALCLN